MPSVPGKIVVGSSLVHVEPPSFETSQYQLPRHHDDVAFAVGAAHVGGIREVLGQNGVIRGFHADVDPELTGRPIQAMVQVRMQSHARGQLQQFMVAVSELPGVRNTYLLGGAHDFFIHVATPDTDTLREFVIAHLSGNPDVALTETNLIFSHTQAWA